MAVESIFYSVSGLSCRGALIWDDGVKAPRPLLLMATGGVGFPLASVARVAPSRPTVSPATSAAWSASAVTPRSWTAAA